MSVPNATNAAATSSGETSGFNRFHHIFDQLHGAQLTRVVLYKDTATGQGTLSTLMQVTGFSSLSFLPAVKRHGHAELFRCCCCARQDVWLKKRELLVFGSW